MAAAAARVAARAALFGSYLKMTSHCTACELALEPYRADDAPAYFTIFVVGHIVVPLVLLLERWGNEPPLWVHALLWLPLSVVTGTLLAAPHKRRRNCARSGLQRMGAPKPSAGSFDPSA